VPGAKVSIGRLDVKNAGWEWRALEEGQGDATEEERIRCDIAEEERIRCDIAEEERIRYDIVAFPTLSYHSFNLVATFQPSLSG
jgi:hypothetical protein